MTGRAGEPARADGAPVRIRIDTVAVTGASAAEARRLADALPGALERAWRRTARASDSPSSSPARARRPARSGRTADTVADEVVRAARRELDRWTGAIEATGGTGGTAP
jgi:hypothetical protein